MKRVICFLVCLSVIAILTTVPAMAAAPQAGQDPGTAVPLQEGVNKGTLAPGEEYWYTFNRPKSDTQTEYMALTLIHIPGEGNITNRVNFEVFTGDKLYFWVRGDKMVNTGAGTVVSRDDDPNTGEHMWAGDVMRGLTYYIRIFNQSGATITYQLFTGDVARVEFGKPAAVKAGPAPAPGANPAVALSLHDSDNPGTLAPGEERWYIYNRPRVSAGTTDHVNMTLIHAPGEGNIANNVNFEIFTGDKLAMWARGSELVNTGAGGIVSRDGDPNTGEHLWSGDMLKGSTYYIKVFNQAKVPIFYRLLTDDVYRVEFGEKPAAVAAPPAAPGSNPAVAMTFKDINEGNLGPGESRWYTFVRPRMGLEPMEYMALTLVHVPGEGNISNRVNFEIFTGDKLALWARGDKLVNTGADQKVSRDDDPNTGEHLWAGDVMQGETYYIQVRNESDVPIFYKFFKGDVINTEFGPKAPAKIGPAAPSGSNPAVAMTLKEGLNDGRLGPGESRWYTFVRPRIGVEPTEYMALTLIHVPGEGNISNRVNFEIFTGDKLALWARGDKLANTGADEKVSRDDDPNTGEHFWAGDVMQGETYYVQVRNESDVSIYYKLFTGDVIHTEFGE